MADLGLCCDPQGPRLVELSRYRVHLAPPSTLDSDEIVAPRREDVHDFVRSLDGRQFDQVLLLAERDGKEVQVSVEGDSEGGMTMTIRDPQTISRLVEGSRSDDAECEVQSGGVAVPRPCNQVVTIDLVEVGLAHFLEEGELSRSVAWVHEPSVVPEADEVS